jgi:hypothetical protein|tara:strand:+ start:496 stop:753 length:258 start_codon:yes stop_codon:yes gene_type:complete
MDLLNLSGLLVIIILLVVLVSLSFYLGYKFRSSLLLKDKNRKIVEITSHIVHCLKSLTPEAKSNDYWAEIQNFWIIEIKSILKNE